MQILCVKVYPFADIDTKFDTHDDKTNQWLSLVRSLLCSSMVANFDGHVDVSIYVVVIEISYVDTPRVCILTD